MHIVMVVELVCMYNPVPTEGTMITALVVVVLGIMYLIMRCRLIMHLYIILLQFVHVANLQSNQLLDLKSVTSV